MYKQISNALKKEQDMVAKKFDKSMQVWGKTSPRYKILGNVVNKSTIVIIGPISSKKILPRKLIKRGS